MALKELLPLTRTVQEEVVNATIKSVEKSGKKVSCKKGCGACCRQLVAISGVEADELAQLVAAMPPERQLVIRARFDEAISKLVDAGLIDGNTPVGDRTLIASDYGSRAASLQELARRYFKLQIPCPFLEEESCSIYPDRPLICREYHVTSPAERCARLFEQPIERIEVPVHLGDIVSSTVEKISGAKAYSVPLVLALESSEKHGESLRRCYDGELMVQAMLRELREAWEKSSTKLTETEAEPVVMTDMGARAPFSVVRLHNGSNPEAQFADVELYGPEWQLETTVSVPKGPTSVADFLPLARKITDSVIDASVNSLRESGKQISCKKGCGACCRQLVPISGMEARYLRDLVNNLPEPRHSEISGRFAAARRRLEESGLLAKLLSRADWNDGEVGKLGLKYFAQGMPCPFLKEESCSIYADRPLACREYLVTSPAENCGKPNAQTIDQVSLPFKLWPALGRLEKNSLGRFIPWLPLILALDSDSIPVEPEERSGIDLLRELFSYSQMNRPAQIEPLPVISPTRAASVSTEKKAELDSSFEPSSGPTEIGIDSKLQSLPLEIGSEDEFARVRELFRITGFNERTICRIFQIKDMSDIGSVDRKNVQISGMLGLLIRLFLFIDAISRFEVESILDPVTLYSMRALDLLRVGRFGPEQEKQTEKYYSPVWLYPVSDFVIASDRGKNPDGSTLVRMPDIVFPAIYEGTLRFLRVISNSAAEEALDLCSGSGIAALTLSRNAKRVVACDITSRASHFARFNCRLNGCVNVEVAQGDLYGAIGDRVFDRIVAHPPFVPSSSEALIYRDSGNTGEALIKRIIEDLPRYLRPGGTFYMVSSAWDSKEGLFEERVRGWLGERNGEFDIIFALDKECSPEQIARQLPETKESADPSTITRWRNHFLDLGFKTNVYGAIVAWRRPHGAAVDAGLGVLTKRLRLGESTDGSCFEWALCWYGWCMRREAAGDLLPTINRLKPRLSSTLKVQVTHAVHDGSLIPIENVLESKWPFPASSRVDSWMVQMLTQFDGTRTTEEVYRDAMIATMMPESFQLQNWSAFVVNMIERGHLEIDRAALEI